MQLKELETIKKLYGENFAKFCRDSFSTILETEGLLLHLLKTQFSPNKSLYDDILKNNVKAQFKKYIYGIYNTYLTKPTAKSNLTPFELMEKAGYNLYKCETVDDINSYEKYYAPGEKICTFIDESRIDTHHVFFAIKKNVENIKRENFTNPQREDEYGTSVISIQFTKTQPNILSIKNRYNCKVRNSDATFSNNLDNIIEGLTDSFAKYYDFAFYGQNINLCLPNYVKGNDGRYYKENFLFDDMHYCANNIKIKNGHISLANPDKYEIIDYFLLSKQDKKFLIPRKYQNPIYLGVENDKIIDVKVSKNSKTRLRDITIITNDDNLIIISVNNANQIIEYYNKNIEILSNNAFENAKYLKKFSAPNLMYIGQHCLKNSNLTNFYAPKLKSYQKYLRHLQQLNKNSGNEIQP